MTNSKEATCQYTLASTALGWVGILASPEGIRRLTLPQASESLALAHLEPSREARRLEEAPEAFHDLRKRLEEYFRGVETSFPDALDLVGTPFQKRAWEAARTIPWGETRSYTWVARDIGHPGAARAVGQAMRANPVPIIVPCHRVIGRNGDMRGYGGPDGVGLKRALLNQESPPGGAT
jgi:methylated-DNA-[protein]-cysteine S-methyltransferase